MVRKNVKKALFVIVFAMVIAPFAIQSRADDFMRPQQQIQSEPFIHDQITIKTSNGENLLFDVELALTPAQQAKGMMFRTYMADNSGMLFLFKNEAKRTFWMKNTLLPLDMLFIARDGEIHHIHHRASPQDLTKITSERDSYAVLELKGGISDKLGIKEGDKVIHRVFRNIVSE